MEQVLAHQKICYDRFQDPGVKFVGIVTSSGKLLEGDFRNGVKPFLTKERIEMLCMELSLDYSMRKEFDDSLGKIKSIVSIREDTIVITTPFNECLLIEICDTRIGMSRLFCQNNVTGNAIEGRI